jgi:hypothetical protein
VPETPTCWAARATVIPLRRSKPLVHRPDAADGQRLSLLRQVRLRAIGGPAWTGIPARLAPEHWPGMGRNTRGAEQHEDSGAGGAGDSAEFAGTVNPM